MDRNSTLTATDLNIQVLGLCRFSFPSSGAFQIEHATIQERREALYAPHRLAQRLAWFENALLPSIMAQDDQNFTLIVLAGEDLPASYKERLSLAAAAVPRLKIIYRPAGEHRKICHDVIKASINPAVDIVVQFRLDDDDAIARDYVTTIRAETKRMAVFIREANAVAFDHNRGLAVRFINQQLDVERMQAQYWGCTLAVAMVPTHAKMILDYPHHRIWESIPTITYPQPVMFMRGIHDTNDSPAIHYTRNGQIQGGSGVKTLAKRFGIHADALLSALIVASQQTS